MGKSFTQVTLSPFSNL